MIYLVSPYSHPDAAIREQRFSDVCIIAGRLTSDYGMVIFCPIAMNHPITERTGLPTDFAYWRKFDEKFVGAAEMVLVACMDGWRESAGVTAEIKMAQDMGKPISYICRDCVQDLLAGRTLRHSIAVSCKVEGSCLRL